MGEATALGLIGLGAVVVVLLALLHTPLPVPPVGVIAHTSGLLAGYGVAVMLLLMARVPVLERGVGPDRMARWHALGGRTVLVLILVHAVAATVGWAQLQQEDLLSAADEVLGFPGLVAATVGTVLFAGVGVVSMRMVRRRVSYELWHLLHLVTYLAIALSFAHELAGPDLAGDPVVQVGWSLLYAVAFGCVLRYRLLAPLLGLARHRLRVDSVIREADDVVSIVLRGRYLDDLRAEPGQFFRWRFLTASTWHTANPISLSAPPTDRFLRLTVKAVGAGTRAIQSVQPGTRVLAEGPYGAMTERRRRGRGVLLIGGGVGITPMRALFETVGVPGRQLTLLYRAAGGDVLFREELIEIAHARGAHLILITGPSRAPGNALTPENLRAWIPDVAERDVFLCASPGLSRALRSSLSEAGLPPERVHQEEFAF